MKTKNQRLYWAGLILAIALALTFFALWLGQRRHTMPKDVIGKHYSYQYLKTDPEYNERDHIKEGSVIQIKKDEIVVLQAHLVYYDPKDTERKNTPLNGPDKQFRDDVTVYKNPYYDPQTQMIYADGLPNGIKYIKGRELEYNNRQYIEVLSGEK